MTVNRRRLWLLSGALFLLLFALTACTADRFEAGNPINKEDLESVSLALFGTMAETEPPKKYPAGTVFWSPTGTVYHADPDCYHLRRAETVQHGSISKAYTDGVKKPCSHCVEDK